jgi:hypothetical protein
VFFPERAPWLPELEAELFAFPGSRHDDQVDSISQALNVEDPSLIWALLARSNELMSNPNPVLTLALCCANSSSGVIPIRVVAPCAAGRSTLP